MKNCVDHTTLVIRFVWFMKAVSPKEVKTDLEQLKTTLLTFFDELFG